MYNDVSSNSNLAYLKYLYSTPNVHQSGSQLHIFFSILQNNEHLDTLFNLF